MKDMSAYKITEADIEAVIRYLKIHDPKNADREFALVLLDTMQRMAKELVQTDITSAVLLKEALEQHHKKENP